MTYQFDQPEAGGDKIPFKERGAELVAANSLMLFHVHEVVPKIKTIHTKPGEEGSDAVRADVVFLTGPLGGEYFGNALIFPKVLVSSLRGKVGKQVLGKLGLGNAKPGQNAAYTLMPFSDSDAQIAMQYLASFPDFGKAQPVEDVPEPPPGWGGQTTANGWGGTQTATSGWGTQTATAAPPPPPTSPIDKMIARGAPGPLAGQLQAAGITDAEIDRLPTLSAGWQQAQAGQIMAVLRPQQNQGWQQPPSNEPPF